MYGELPIAEEGKETYTVQPNRLSVFATVSLLDISLKKRMLVLH